MKMNKNPILRVLEEVEGSTNPRIVILVAHGLIELMVNTLIDAHCKNRKAITSDTRGYPHTTKLLILNECGVIHDAFYRVLNRLRKLRNDAAHEPFFDVDEYRLRQIAEPMMPAFESIPEVYNKTFSSVNGLCSTIIQSLWDTHMDVLSPVFSPGVYSATKRENHSDSS